MNTPKTSFRLDPKLLRQMDRIINEPTSIAFDGERGAARNRTELVAVLLKKAIDSWEKERAEKAAAERKGS